MAVGRKKKEAAGDYHGTKRAPARTPEERERQMIALAVDESERQIREGTAPGMIIVHYLKLATVKEQLERQKLENEALLLQARVEDIKNGADILSVTEQALAAFKSYHGEDVEFGEYEG